MTDATPLASEQITQEDRITAAIGEADAAFGYTFNLTRLVDGEETHTLSMSGFDPVDFSDRDEGYALIAKRRNKARAEAVLAALSTSPAPSGQGVSEEVARLVADLNGIREAFERIAEKHPNDQPAYKDGVRPWGTGDLRHVIETLTAAATRLAAPAPSCAPGEVERLIGVEGIGASFNRETDCWHFYTMPDTRPLPVTVGPGYDRGLSDWVIAALRAALSPQGLDAKEDGEVSFQERVQPWLMACFGEMIAGDREERNHRFLEEALELVQACGCTAHEAHQLVDYVYGRPVGELHQEIGGVMVTLAALCLANDADMHAAGFVELHRIWGKVEQIRAKQAAKPKHSPLPQALSATPAPSDQDASQAQGEGLPVNAVDDQGFSDAECNAVLIDGYARDADRKGWRATGDALRRAAGFIRGYDALTAKAPAPGATAQDGIGDGQDRKFAFRDGQYVNRVSGEPIPHDEPIIIFRARDHHSIHVLREYLTMVTDEHHRQAIRDRMAEFSAYAAAHPERMKEPGITHDIRHNDPTPTIPAGMVVEAGRLIQDWRDGNAGEDTAEDTAQLIFDRLAAAPKQAEQRVCSACDGSGMKTSGDDCAGCAGDLIPSNALRGIADDFMTSEQHHPGYVLIPTAKFEQLRAAAEALEASHD